MQCFEPKFKHILLTFQHRAGVSPYTSPCGFAETCVFAKQSLGPIHCGFTCVKHPFSRSYGVILPSSLTRVLPITLGFSPRLPVSVCGTGTRFLARGFSWQCEIRNFGTIFPSRSQLVNMSDGFAYLTHSLLRRTQPVVRIPYPTASPHCSNGIGWYRNINLLSIVYALRPRLRSRLTLSGRAFLRKP